MSTSNLSAVSYSTVPAWGRAWKLALYPLVNSTFEPIPPGGTDNSIILSDSAWEPETPRVTFSVLHIGVPHAWWWADISFYNLDVVVEQRLIGGWSSVGQYVDTSGNSDIQQGDVIVLSAGYQNDFNADNALIWKGQVFQPLFERLNAVDYKLTLRCAIGKEVNQKLLTYTEEERGASQAAIVQHMAAAAHVPISEPINETFLNKTFPRRKVFFNYLQPELQKLMHDQREQLFQMWVSEAGLHGRTLYPNTAAEPDLVYAPMPAPGDPTPFYDNPNTCQTLIGTPQQTQYGIVFRVLLDPRIKIGYMIRLDYTVMKTIPLYPGQKFNRLEADGLYIVQQVRHVGDTRGNDWYSECICVTQSFFDRVASKGLV